MTPLYTGSWVLGQFVVSPVLKVLAVNKLVKKKKKILNHTFYLFELVWDCKILSRR